MVCPISKSLIRLACTSSTYRAGDLGKKAGFHAPATTLSTTCISLLIQKTARSKLTPSMCMDESTRLSRPKTSNKPSSSVIGERKVKPRRRQRNDSQYFTRGAFVLCSLFCTVLFCTIMKRDVVISMKKGRPYARERGARKLFGKFNPVY